VKATILHACSIREILAIAGDVAGDVWASGVAEGVAAVAANLTESYDVAMWMMQWAGAVEMAGARFQMREFRPARSITRQPALGSQLQGQEQLLVPGLSLISPWWRAAACMMCAGFPGRSFARRAGPWPLQVVTSRSSSPA